MTENHMWTEKKLQALAKKLLAEVGIRGSSLDIFLLSNAEIKALKAQFIKKKTEPNVLAFPESGQFPHPETKKIYLGEIYLNKDILRKSPERATPLLLHGILHLLGYDHKKKKDIKEMEGLEKRILFSSSPRRRGSSAK